MAEFTLSVTQHVANASAADRVNPALGCVIENSLDDLPDPQ